MITVSGNNDEPGDFVLRQYPKLEPVDAVDDLRQNLAEELNTFAMTSDQIKLQEMRDRGEISPHNCDLNELYQFIDNGIPLTAAILGNQAVVLLRGQFDQLGGYLDITLLNGEEIRIRSESMNDPILIIFPGDLG